MLRIIAGKWRHQRLKLPPTGLARPTTDRAREALFNILVHSYHIDFGNIKVADIFAGSGAIGLECLSRGTQSVVFVENNPSVMKILAENIKMLYSETNTRVIKTTLPYLPHCTDSPPDLIFLDPPYYKDLVAPTCLELRNKGWLKTNTIICIETSLRDVPQSLPGLNCDQQRQYGQSTIGFWVYTNS